MTLEREKVLALWAEVSTLYPDMRMGQLLTWFAGAARGATAESLYDVEDVELIAVMDDYLRRRNRELVAVAG